MMLARKFVCHIRPVSLCLCAMAPRPLVDQRNCVNAFSTSIVGPHFVVASASIFGFPDVPKTTKTFICNRNYSVSRKSGRGRKPTPSKAEDDDDDEEDDDDESDVEEDDGLPKDYRTMDFVLLSRRLDAVVGRALNVSITSIAKAILEGKVRVNETVIIKKAQEIEQADEMDVWVSTYEDNDRLAITRRVRIVRCRFDKREGYRISAKCWTNFVTDNWLREDASGGGRPREKKEDEKR
uniref:RNA-binding S4 domain-containing protein n=1 Tax=Globodera rostochiensis TaxID=31243 RepID=A0A914I8X3_GLORO